MKDPNEIICHCNQITYETIVKAIHNGANSVEEVTELTNAGIACGYCIETIEEILEDLKK